MMFSDSGQFLDSVLSSLETGKPSPMPTSSRQPEPPISSYAKPEARKSGMGTLPDRGNPSAGTKRKADDQLQRRPKPASQIPGKPATPIPSTVPAASRPRPNPTTTAKPQPSTTTSAAQKPSDVSSKPPPKGSFADLMAKAKNLQQNASTNVGMLKHQSAPKERLSKAERKKRMIEARTKGKDAPPGKKDATSSVGPAAARKRGPEEPSYKGTSRPKQPAQPAYRGTAGLPSRRDPKDRKASQSQRSRMDDYLGTDEEDEGDYAGGDDYYSESSDMEAGMDDVEQEEQSALKAARREDEEEWLAEQAAKRAKLERRNKLTALSSKSR